MLSSAISYSKFKCTIYVEIYSLSRATINTGTFFEIFLGGIFQTFYIFKLSNARYWSGYLFVTYQFVGCQFVEKDRLAIWRLSIIRPPLVLFFTNFTHLFLFKFREKNSAVT